MALTVSEFINIEEFKDFRLLCGNKGLQRRITTVSVMEDPIFEDWIRGGEMLIASAYIIKNGINDLPKLIQTLHARGTAVLLIKLEHYFTQLPNDIVDMANELGFPIIDVPNTFAFSDVIGPVMKKLIDEQTSAIRLSENINTSFINIVINGGGITEIINTIATLINQNVAFYDIPFNKIYPSKSASLRENFNEVFSHSYPNFSIALEEKEYGSIIILDEGRKEFNCYEEMILNHASTALKLIAQKYISNMEIESRYRDGFVQDIVLNNIKSLQEVVKRGKIYGWDLSDKWYTTVIVDIDDFKLQYLNIRNKKDSEDIEKRNDEIFDYSLKSFRKYYKSVLYTKFTDSTAFIIKHEKPGSENANKIYELCAALKEELVQLYHFSVTIGIGESKNTIMECYLGYQEAQKSVKISRLIFKRDHVMLYSELGIYKFLDGIKDNLSVREFYREYIDKICRHDEQHNTDFMETLINIVQSGWNLKMASDAMYLHYNTIKYRYKKIEEISGLDLDRTEEKLSMELAVKIYLMNHM